jgi:hypothetical protein
MIITAPRDGSRVLLWAYTETPPAPPSVMVGYHDIAFGWVSLGCAGLMPVIPTHWMPLPEGPNKGE